MNNDYSTQLSLARVGSFLGPSFSEFSKQIYGKILSLMEKGEEEEPVSPYFFHTIDGHKTENMTQVMLKYIKTMFIPGFIFYK